MTAIVDVLLEAVQALRVHVYTVEPWSHGYQLWLVNRETLTDGAVVVLALRLGLMDRPVQLQ